MAVRVSGAARGLVAGAVGTLALEATEPIERVLLGRAPVYAPRRIARRLLPRLGFLAPSRNQIRRGGRWMRWAYGPGLGLAYGWLRPALNLPGWARGLALGAGVLAMEWIALPAVGAVPRMSTWPGREKALLMAHTVLYGLCTELSLSLARRENS